MARADREQEEDYDYDPTDEEFVEDEDEIVTYLSWHAHGRPYKQHSVEYYTNSFFDHDGY